MRWHAIVPGITQRRFFPSVVTLYGDVLFLPNADLLAHGGGARDFPIPRAFPTRARSRSCALERPIIF